MESLKENRFIVYVPSTYTIYWLSWEQS